MSHGIYEIGAFRPHPPLREAHPKDAPARHTHWLIQALMAGEEVFMGVGKPNSVFKNIKFEVNHVVFCKD